MGRWVQMGGGILRTTGGMMRTTFPTSCDDTRKQSSKFTDPRYPSPPPQRTTNSEHARRGMPPLLLSADRHHRTPFRFWRRHLVLRSPASRHADIPWQATTGACCMSARERRFPKCQLTDWILRSQHLKVGAVMEIVYAHDFFFFPGFRFPCLLLSLRLAVIDT